MINDAAEDEGGCPVDHSRVKFDLDIGAWHHGGAKPGECVLGLDAADSFDKLSRFRRIAQCIERENILQCRTVIVEQ